MNKTVLIVGTCTSQTMIATLEAFSPDIQVVVSQEHQDATDKFVRDMEREGGKFLIKPGFHEDWGVSEFNSPETRRERRARLRKKPSHY